LNSNHFYFVHTLTGILMSSLRRTWQLKNCKKLSHVRSKLRSKLSSFTGGTPPFVKGQITSSPSTSLWGGRLWTTGYTRRPSRLK
jgi:hypothetical protein